MSSPTSLASGGDAMNDAPAEYIAKAISNEVAVVANAQTSTRNQILNRSAFKLGTIPGAQLDTVVGTLLPAAQANGYVAEHGEHAARKVIESGFQNGQRKQRKVPRLNRAERRCMALQSKRAVNTSLRPTALTPFLDVNPARSSFPPRTQPDKNGKPRFLIVASKGPAKGDGEKRRHVFVRGSEPVRIKVMLKNGGAVNWYRVQDADGTLGWQARKPDGFFEVPYVGEPILSIEKWSLMNSIGRKARRMWIPLFASAFRQSHLAVPVTGCPRDALHILPDAVLLFSLTTTPADVNMLRKRRHLWHQWRQAFA
jgi:hypothetical protein